MENEEVALAGLAWAFHMLGDGAAAAAAAAGTMHAAETKPVAAVVVAAAAAAVVVAEVVAAVAKLVAVATPSYCATRDPEVYRGSKYRGKK